MSNYIDHYAEESRLIRACYVRISSGRPLGDEQREFVMGLLDREQEAIDTGKYICDRVSGRVTLT